MKIGIIVYSKTGNTLHVAERIRETLAAEGNSVTVEHFCAETLPNSNTPVRLTATPDTNKYDVVIFGAPVQAFSLDPAMSMYLNQIGKASAKPALCFMTQYFRKPWMGGNHAMKQMLALLQKKGFSAEPMGIVNWSSDQREDQITVITRRCNDTLKGARA